MERGMVADIGEWRPPPKRRMRPGLIIVPAAIVVMLVAAMLYPIRTDESAVKDETTGELELIERTTNGTHTIWRFYDMAWLQELEYDFIFVFEVHNCSGSPGIVHTWEHNGNYLAPFNYTGSADVYLGTIERTTFYNGDMTSHSWEWFGNVTRDYRAGNWTTEQGIEFVHADNQHFLDARLVALWFVPIPEFSDIIVPILLLCLIVIIGRYKCRRE